MVVLCPLVGCSSSDDSSPSVPSTVGTNFISNSSFENTAGPSLKGWAADTTDTSAVKFVRDVPPSCGKYAIYLHSEFPSLASVTCTAVIPAGTHRYRLSAWAKCGSIGPEVALGGVSLLHTWQGTKSGKALSYSDTTWAYKTLVDTINVAKPSTVRIVLTQSQGGYVLFDLCRLAQLD